MKKTKILLVDDEARIRFGVRDYLEAQGFELIEAEDCKQALKLFASTRPDAAIIDYRLPDGTALELLPDLREIDADVPLLVLTGHGSIELAIKAIKLGADLFLTKPVEMPALLILLRRMLENRRVRRKQQAWAARDWRERVDPFLGESAAIHELAGQAHKLLAAGSPVLLQGETGVGKGVLAAWLHHNGPRAEEPFVDLNCAGLSREFLETELFGQEKGAFTGAVAAKQGLLEVASGGTLFLDEIGDMDLQIQAKLLKVLEEKRFRKLGEVRERLADVRLISATHQDLGVLTREKKFRSDLYFRIGTLTLTAPPLGERVEDIPLLSKVLLNPVAADLSKGPIGIATDAVETLQNYHWPGYVRAYYAPTCPRKTVQRDRWKRRCDQ